MTDGTSTGGTDRDLLAEMAERLFAENCGPAVRQAAQDSGWAADLWDLADRAGLTRLGVPEQAGGSGGDCADALAVLQAAGRHAVPLPLAESSLLGGWLLAEAGIAVPDGPLSVPVPHPGDGLEVSGGPGGWRVSGRLGRVPWAERATGIAALALVRTGGAAGDAAVRDGDAAVPDGAAEGRAAEGRAAETGDAAAMVVLLDPRQAVVSPAVNVAGEPRDRVVLGSVPLPEGSVAPAPAGTGERLALRGALSRAALLAGAAAGAADLTVGYARQRRQFGQPIGRFQAVGARLVQLSSEAELAGLAATVAGLRFAERDLGAAFEAGAAKATAARAAAQVGTHAHQVHGAIGMTQEYELHHFTRRLLAWRDEWGSERDWAARLGEGVLAAGAQALWPQIATGLVGTA
jgi:acyl-CoA dehydrogenase